MTSKYRCYLVLILLIFSLIPFATRVSNGMHFFTPHDLIDINIFSSAEKKFIATGNLYQRTLYAHEYYAPGTASYKFPPAYQLTIMPFMKIGSTEEVAVFKALRILYFIFYLVGVALVITQVTKLTTPSFHKKNDARYVLIYVGLTLTIATWFVPFYDCFISIEPEMIVFFFLAITFRFIFERPFIAGFALGIASAIKLYPAFIILYFIFTKEWKGLSGFTAALFTITGLSIYVFGIDEHLFYIKSILPILMTETPISSSQNITLEAFFYIHGFIAEMNGTISSVTKYLMFFSLFYTGVFFEKKYQDKRLIYFYMVVIAILLYLPNYWSQYQIILIVPLFGLIHHALNKNLTGLLTILLLISIIMSIDRDWWLNILSSGIHYVIAQEAILAFVEKNNASNSFRSLAAIIGLLSNICELRIFVPIVLYISCGWLLYCEPHLNGSVSLGKPTITRHHKNLPLPTPFD